MMSYLSIVLAAVLVSTSQAAPTPTPVFPPICNGTIVVSPPTDLSKPFYWPAGYNENMPAPAHTIDEVCTIFVKVPKGLNAKLTMKAKMDGDAYIFLNDDAPYNQYLNQSNLEPYFFVNNHFYVSLVSGQKSKTGTLGLKIVYSKFPSSAPNNVYIGTGYATFQPTNRAQNGTVVQTSSGSRVSLLPIPISPMNQDSLRNTLVFDGPSYYSNYIGNLYKIFASKNQFISRGNSLTLLTFEAQNVQDSYVVQDYRDTMGLSQYTAVTCDDKMNCPTTLDATAGKAAAISISTGGETLTSANIDRTATLSVYANTISDAELLDKLDYSTTMTNLPHKYRVNIRQYVIDKGVATLGLSRK